MNDNGLTAWENNAELQRRYIKNKTLIKKLRQVYE